MTGETMVKEMVVCMLPVAVISRSPANPRMIRENDPKVAELAKNIGRLGLMQPITVRPEADGYEIIAGERRWRAFLLLAAENPEVREIPAFIREMSDEDAHELTVTENLQRKDLSPIEEANGIQTLIRESGRTLEEIADKLGKPVSWVAKRANLVKLSQKWREAIADPEHIYSKWSVGHVELIARYDEAVQDEIFALCNNSWQANKSIKDLRNDLARFSRKLSGAAWKVSESGPAGTEACRQCPKRTSVQPHLFEEEQKAKQGDQCLDRVCWEKNALAFLDQKEKDLAAEYTALAYIDKSDYNNRTVPNDSPLRKKKLLDSYMIEDAKKNEEEAFPTLIIDGPGQGTVKWFKYKEDYRERGEKPPVYDTGGNKLPKTLAERREALEKRRTIRFIGRVYELVDQEMHEPKLVRELNLMMIEAAVLSWGAQSWRQMNGGAYRNREKKWAEYHELEAEVVDGTTMGVFHERMMVGVLWHWREDLKNEGQAYKPNPENAAEVCRFLGIDGDAIREEIKGEIKEPKVWVDLNEDGTKKKKGK